jgi:hypothetical protein
MALGLEDRRRRCLGHGDVASAASAVEQLPTALASYQDNGPARIFPAVELVPCITTRDVGQSTQPIWAEAAAEGAV